MTTVIGYTGNGEHPGPTLIVGANRGNPGTVTVMGCTGDFAHFPAEPYRQELTPAHAREHALNLLRAADVAEHPCCAWHDQQSPKFNSGATECGD